MVESSFVEVAKYTGIAGLALFVLFALVKGMLAMDVFTRITSEHTYIILNKLINVVLVISLVAMLSGLVGKCNPSIGDLLIRKDNNTYTITFDEIQMMYMGFGLPSEMKDYRICFEARSGNDIITKEIEKVLGSYVPERGLASPIPLRGLQIKNVKGSEGCSIRLGFDPTILNACADNADIVFKSEISRKQFDSANHLAAFPPINMQMSNFILDVKYTITKQNE